MFLAKKGMKSRKPRIEPSVASSRPANHQTKHEKSLSDSIGYLPPDEVFKGLEDNNETELQILSYIFYVFLAVIVLANFVSSIELVKFKGFLPSGAYLSYGIMATILVPSAIAGIFLILPGMRTINRFMLIFATVSLSILFTNVIMLNFMGLFGNFQAI